MLMISLILAFLVCSPVVTLTYFNYLNNKARKKMHEYL